MTRRCCARSTRRRATRRPTVWRSTVSRCSWTAPAPRWAIPTTAVRSISNTKFRLCTRNRRPNWISSGGITGSPTTRRPMLGGGSTPIGWAARPNMALQLDSLTNNTSLVLAIELPDGDVLAVRGRRAGRQLAVVAGPGRGRWTARPSPGRTCSSARSSTRSAITAATMRRCARRASSRWNAARRDDPGRPRDGGQEALGQDAARGAGQGARRKRQRTGSCASTRRSRRQCRTSSRTNCSLK